MTQRDDQQPMPSLRIAAAQSISVPGDIAANVAVHRNFILAASRLQVDMVVFPELSLSGYELPQLCACALQPDDSVLAPLRELAASHAITIVVGAPILSESNGVHIGAITFFPNGASAIYCKQHLHASEERFATASSMPSSTYVVGGEAVALAICADIAHETHPQAAASAGASVYIASVLVSEPGYAPDANQLQSYAKRHSLATLMANHGGPSGGYVSAGKSAFWSPDGELIVAAPGADSFLVVASKNASGWTGEVHAMRE